MTEETIRDTIENVCKKVFASMNLTEDQMWEASVRMSEYMMSESSKETLAKIKEDAKKGVPEDLEKAYHIAFLAGYNCGMTDEQKKRR